MYIGLSGSHLITGVMLGLFPIILVVPAYFAQEFPGADFNDPDKESVPSKEDLEDAKKTSAQQCLEFEKIPQDRGPDGRYDCHTPGYGPNYEFFWQEGRCMDGQCVMSKYPVGCVGKTPPETDTDGLPPVGCAFVCYNEKEKNRPEYGIYPVGHACRHYRKLKTPVTLTCIPWKNVTVCRDQTPRPPGC